MSKWIKNGDNNYRSSNTNGPEVEPKSIWKRVFGGVILCAMLVLAGWTAWTAMNGGFKNDTNPTPPAEMVGDKAHDMIGGSANVDDDGAGRLNPSGDAVPSAFAIATYGETPTLETLQGANVPYVYAEDGAEIALFAISCIVTNQDDVNFDELRLTDGCVNDYKPLIDVELPSVVYFDANQSARYVKYQDQLYLLAPNKEKLAGIRDQLQSWTVFGADFETIRQDDNVVKETANEASDGDNILG